MPAFLEEHHLVIGLLADTLTFAGALVLARDAFHHLKDLQDRRIHETFRKEFSELPLVSWQVAEAQGAGRIAWRGFLVLALGFLFQTLSRFAEP